MDIEHFNKSEFIGLRPQSASPIRRKIMNSPFLRRRYKNCQESSDDEGNNASGDEVFNGTNYKDLETFQKSQLRQKVLILNQGIFF